MSYLKISYHGKLTSIDLSFLPLTILEFVLYFCVCVCVCNVFAQKSFNQVLKKSCNVTAMYWELKLLNSYSLQVVIILLLILHYLLYPYGRYLVGMYSNTWHCDKLFQTLNASRVHGFLRTVVGKVVFKLILTQNLLICIVLDITHNNAQ